MNIETTRFGTVTVADDRVISFPKGLLGFPTQTRFVLIESAEEASPQPEKSDRYFWWLQSVDQPALAFVVTDPRFFVRGYSIPMHPEQLAALSLEASEDAQVLVIVNKVDQTLTGNLQGPLVINASRWQGEQMVLSDRRFTTRVPLMDVGEPTPVVTAKTAPAPAASGRDKKVSAAVA